MAIKQVIVVNRALNMRKGKMCAQVAHASMKFLLDLDDAIDLNRLNIPLSQEEAEWLATGHAKIVVGCDSEEELRNLIMKAEVLGVTVHSIVDEGRTEFHGVPTLTCAAFGPADEADVNKVTGKLGLL